MRSGIDDLSGADWPGFGQRRRQDAGATKRLREESSDGELTMTEAFREKPNAETVPAAAAAGIVVSGKYIPPPEDRDGRSWVRTTAHWFKPSRRRFMRCGAIWRTCRSGRSRSCR